MDSSGILQVDKDGKVYAYKEAMAGSDFINDTTAQQFIRDVSKSVVTICHVRAATHGKVVKENAHPFTFVRDDKTTFSGVHNGTLYGWQNRSDAKDFNVDSEWALNRICHEGIDAFENINGAYTFVWWDEKHKDKVFMARNSQRPMFFALTKDKATMLFASEAGMLSWLAERNKIEVQDTIYSLEEGKLYTFDLSGTEISWSKVNLPERKYTSAVSDYYRTRSEDDVWEEYYSRYSRGGASSQQRNQWPATTKRSDGDISTTGLALIEAAKKALAENRAARFPETSGTTVTTKKPSKKQLRRERARQRAEEAKKQAKADVCGVSCELPAYGDNLHQCREEWYSKSSATQTEQQAAKSAGVMGDLQWFTGVMFDPDTGDIVGEFEDFSAGKGKVKYMATMRMQTASIADRIWINGGGGWVAVIGSKPYTHGTGTEYIVAEVNEKGQNYLNRQAS